MSAATQRSSKGNRNRQHTMSNRGAYPSSNSYGRRETPEPEPPNSSPAQGIFADPRTAMVMCSFMGTRTSVKTRNGSTYKGHTTGFSEKGDIAMSDVKLEDDDSNTQNPYLSGIIIPKDKFVVCKTNGVDLKGLCATADFTDSGIVSRLNGSSDGQFKELQPWQDDDAPEISRSLSLDDTNGGWDSHQMFQVNTEKFNVQSSYNENMHEYTTKLPDPRSEGYEEREKFAQKQAEEIERSETYQDRISKELNDGDEELRYSAVHRGNESHPPHRSHESNTNSGKNTYVAPALRGEGDQVMRNGNLPRGPGNRLQRQNSPYSSASHPQQQQQQQQQQHAHHQSVQNSRQINNHYPGPPPSGGPLSRNQGPPLMHPRQQQQQQSQNHAAPPLHSHHQQFQQQPPPSHPGMPQPPQHQQQAPVSSQQQQPQRPSSHHQLVSPTHPQKSHLPPPHHAPVPSSVSSISQQPPPQAQHPPPQKLSPPHSQPPTQQPPPVKGISPNANGPSGPPPSVNQPRQPMPMQVNGAAEGQNVEAQKTGQVDLRAQHYHQQPPTSMPLSAPSVPPAQKGPDTQLSASSSSSSLVDSQQMAPQANPSTATSPPAALAAERRAGRGLEPIPDDAARNKNLQSLREFQDKFVLEANGSNSQEPPGQDEATESVPVSSTSSPAVSSVAPTPVSSTSEVVARSAEPTADTQIKATEKAEEAPSVSKFKLNPNAKEFKPKSQTVPAETQSPSPQPRTSPLMAAHPMVHFQQTPLLMYQHPPHAAAGYILPNQLNQQRKRATVSLSGTTVDLTAHQVTGQPLVTNQPHLATQPQHMMYLPTGQPLAAGYQLYSPQMRMVPPNSLGMAQTGQVTGLDQTANQNQPQPVFITTQQQPVPIPAHLHPQPAHAQPLPHPSSNQQATPTHVPNPAPSPVHHQQHNSQPLPQSLPHHLSQGPPQSATPQPAHYPQLNFSVPSHAVPAGVPRTSMSGQQNMGGHHTVSISNYSLMSASQYTYPNGSTPQYTYAPAAQPQTSQNSSHAPGPQAQYVMMPQPTGQNVPSMQQHAGQPYTAPGMPFQPQPNIMQGPPQLPPSHAPNPSQAGAHLIHPNMPASLHQQVSGTQPGLQYMQQVPSTLQQFQHQQ